jgi:hypothetical protein
VTAAARAAAVPAKSDALVVLGAGTAVEGWANPVLVERVCRGVELYRQGRAGKIVMSGGYTAGHIAEAEMMRAAAVAMGVPAEDVILENSSVTTAENADFSLLLAKKAGIRAVTVVTHRNHLARAIGEFERAGRGYWTVLDGAEANGSLSTACFRAAWPSAPLSSSATYDMLVVDVGDEKPVEETFAREADVPSSELVSEVASAAWRYRTGGAKRLYFAEPVLSTITARGVLGQAHGHISRTELARILATAMGVPFADVVISSGRRFGQVSGSIEPEGNPWLSVPGARVAVAAIPSHRDWWRRRFSDKSNSALLPPDYLEP